MLLRTHTMLYSKSGGRLVFVVDEGSFPQDSICNVVDGVYSSIKAHQVVETAKQEVAFNRLVQELVEPTCEISQRYLEEDLIHDDAYYFEMAAFEFQDTDFLVPTNQFIQHTDSDHFAAIFGPTFGTTETPKQFPGVTASEFRSLMEFFYPLDFQFDDENESDGFNADELVAILKLSTKWWMLTLCEDAIEDLNNCSDSLSAIMKVQLGKECKVTEWVRSGYAALVERKEHFTEADAIAIGLDSVTKLCDLREQGYAGEWDIYCNHLTLEAYRTPNLTADRISRISSVNHLDNDDNDLVTAILDAQSLGNQRMMLDAWGRMARRCESLTLVEVERLTLGTALMMWEERMETRRAARSFVQEYRAERSVNALDTSQRVASAFASELADIEVQALNYRHNTEDEEEIPDSALVPMPSGSGSVPMFDQILNLRTRIVELEQMLKEDSNTTLGRYLWRDLKICRLSAQKWCTSAVGSSPPVSTLDLSLNPIDNDDLMPGSILEDILIKLILKNAAKLSLDGSHLDAMRWDTMRSTICRFALWHHLETQIGEDSKVIDLILPVSES